MAGLRLSKPGGTIYFKDSLPVQNIYAENVTQQYRLNTELIYPDGRKFRYTKNKEWDFKCMERYRRILSFSYRATKKL